MNREYKEVPLDGGENPPKKITVKYIGDPCPSVGHAARAGQFTLLQAVIENPGLLDCGLVPFQTMSMVHNGNQWVITLEAKA